MKNAPNIKHLPDDAFTEVIIFAGADAWVHAEHWQAGNPAKDTTPPVVLGPKQLADPNNLRIIDDGRRFVRVIRAGKLTELQKSIIATKLAVAGVKEARFYSESYELLEDWTEQLPRLSEDVISGNSVVVQMQTAKTGNTRLSTGTADLAQMAASQKAKVLSARWDMLAINPESGVVYCYSSGVWEKLNDSEIERTMVSIFEENEAHYTDKGIKSIVATMKLQIPVIGKQHRDLIGFENGVYDLAAQTFSQHSPENWLMNHNGITYTSPVPDENLATHAPNFTRWLSHATGGNVQKAERIKAALFMVLAKRHDWQLFIEVTGEGRSGKSVFTSTTTTLAGEHNTASGNMLALDTARGRWQFVGKTLIILPDQARYSGEGTGIKAITGGDLVEIDGKYEKQFSTVLNTIVLITNNEPMIFTERNGGIARRRVIFQFNLPVAEADVDPDLVIKIRQEMPVIIRHLLSIFTDQNRAKYLLIEQRESLEALVVKRETDPVINMCAALNFMSEPRGLMMGGGTWAGQPEPRAYLYHLYLSYLEYNGLGKPLSVEKFARAMKNAAREYRGQYLTRKVNGRTQTNISLTGMAEEFLPRVYGAGTPK